MGVFTELDHAALREIAAAFDLGALAGHRPIAAGTINSNYELTTDRGRWFVRVNEGKAEADVAWEARLVTALAERGVATPAPLTARDGRPYAPLAASSGAANATHAEAEARGAATATDAEAGARGTAIAARAEADPRGTAVTVKWVSAFPWRAGHHLAAGEVTAAHAEVLGAELAQLHVAGLALPIDWRRGSIYDHAHLVVRYRGVAASSDPALAHAIAILGEELAAADAAADVRGRATQGIIHGDLFRDNVLWAGERIAALLDFEQASGGSLAYDLAVCINDWCWSDGPRLDLIAAMIAGYGRVRGLTAGDRAALPIEVKAAAARFTVTRITDVYLARVENPEKDFRAFLARIEAWRGPSLGELTSLL